MKIEQHTVDVVEERASLAAEKIEMEVKTESKIAEAEITGDFFEIVPSWRMIIQTIQS